MEEWLKKARSYPLGRSGEELLEELDQHLGGRSPTPEEAYTVALPLSSRFAIPLLERGRDLAHFAWSAGIGSAGPVFARCVDMLSMIGSGRQKYGTLRSESDGELVIPPLDGSVSDQERAELGLPPASAVLAEVAQENMRRALANYSTPLPPGARFRRVWYPVTAGELRARREQEVGPAWADGDIFTLVYEGDGDRVLLSGGLQLPLFNLTGTKVWALMVRVADLDQTVVGYRFMPVAGTEWLQPTNPGGVWRGPAAPPAAARALPLSCPIREVSFTSQEIGEERLISVYLPPGHDPSQESPIIYAADGQYIVGFAEVLEPLILAGRLPKTILVGVHAAAAERRNQEYLPGWAPDRFDAHLRFFTDEIGPWAERTYGASARPEKRAVFGYSSGGAFALEVGRRHGDRFGAVMAFSIAGSVADGLSWQKSIPRHYLVAGVMEDGFRQRTATVAKTLQSLAADHIHIERHGGHDMVIWEEEFAQVVSHWLNNAR